jgi:hypothetical protein
MAGAGDFGEMIMDGVIGITSWNIQEVVRYAYMVLCREISPW